MRVRYPQATLWAYRALGEENGHAFRGKAIKIGLSYYISCLRCRRHVVVTPGWAPWEQDKVAGHNLAELCKGA